MVKTIRSIPAEADIKISWKRSIVENDSDFYAVMRPVISLKVKVNSAMERIETEGAVKELIQKQLDQPRWSRKVGNTKVLVKRG